MARIFPREITEHDELILIMARYFKQLGYTDIKADIPGWLRPDSIYWTNDPNNRFYPDLTCFDANNKLIILEAETCSTLTDQHTQDQFRIFRAHADNNYGRFDVIVPRICFGKDCKELIRQYAKNWGITLNTVWTPSI